MFYYTAFGFNIVSDIHFPELSKGFKAIPFDLQIRIGSIPIFYDINLFARTQLIINRNQYAVQITNVANYYAENGSLIIVEPHPKADQKTIRIYLLCNAIAAVIYQRNLIPLHASGIITKNGVVLIIGESGAGKSTTIKALVDRGHKIFTDDVCAIKNYEDKVLAMPSYPMMKLWDNTFALLNLGDKNEEQRIWPNTNKFGLFFHDDFVSRWMLISKIFVLQESSRQESVSMQKQNFIEAFQNIAQNTYRREYIEPMQLTAVHFLAVASLVQQFEIHKIVRPSGQNTIEEVVKLLENEIGIVQ